MKGDFSRFTFDPKKHYTGVRMQQGRIQLDADWNEQIDLQLNRERRELRDIIGYTGGPRDNLGFKITANGNKLTVGKGHYYVAGRLCWNEHEFDIENPEDIDDGTYLAYLDVWERHVTWLEDADIREVALGGPDTATRTQLISQVKLMPVEPGVNCSDYGREDWVPNQHMSTAMMAARSTPVQNPPHYNCAPLAQAGYTGMENQLYRVEIHEINEKTVNFKWSRENGCIATRWTASGGNTLTVMSTGLDDKLGFKPDDLVELTDETHEKACTPGILAKLSSVEGNTLTIDSAINLTGNGTVRRWEGQQEFLANTTGAQWFQLEDGIEIAFAVGTFQPGDHWTIPARAFLGRGPVEGQGDILWPKDENEIPVFKTHDGPEHVYSPLAICLYRESEWSTSSCQNEFIPLSEVETEGDGCCIRLSPGDDIQDAIDSIPQEGGCICLKSGDYEIKRPITIEGRSNLFLRGETTGVRIFRNTWYKPDRISINNSLIEIRNSDRIKLEGISLEVVPDSNYSVINEADPIPAVNFDRCEDVKLIDSQITLSSASPDFPPELMLFPLCAIRVQSCRKVKIIDNNVSSFPYCIVIMPDSSRIVVDGNSFFAPSIQFEDNRHYAGTTGIYGIIDSIDGYNNGFQILHNNITGYLQGIHLLGKSEGVMIIANTILRKNHYLKEGAVKSSYYFGIIIESIAGKCSIKENFILLSSNLQGGIWVEGAEALIEKNTIESEVSAEQLEQDVPVGIFMAPAANNVFFPDSSIIQENRFYGLQVAVHLNHAADIKVLHNLIDLLETGGTNSKGIFCEHLNGTEISDNTIKNADIGIILESGIQNVLKGNRLITGKIGTLAMEEAYLNVSDSEAVDMKWAGLIALYLTYTATISRCRFLRCGYETIPEPYNIKVGASVGLGLCFAEVIIEHCQILDTGLPPYGEPSTEETYGIYMQCVTSCHLQGNLVGFTKTIFDDIHRNREDRALFLGGMIEGKNPVKTFGSALISNNKFLGPGKTNLVQFDNDFRFEKVNFSGNHCVHYSSDPEDKSATIAIRGGNIIVMGNHVKASEKFPSMDFGNQEHVVLMGNVTTGDFLPAPFNNSKPQPLADYNLKI